MSQIENEQPRGLSLSIEKMRAAQVAEPAINVFSDFYYQLLAGVSGSIPEESIEPLLEVPKIEDIEVDPKIAKEAFDQLVIINLNGGLGTSMGMDKAKSLLPVRDGLSFLDIIVHQVLAARKATGARLPLLFMNSFRTREDSLEVLAKYPELKVDELPLDFIQNKEPKLRRDNLEPVQWPKDPELEWCPPGHGDIYTALLTSGVLDQLIDAGFRYASISNSDNLGTVPSPELAGWFAASKASYAAELCRRTAADRKGGHLAIRKSDKRLILRDTAQTPAHQMDYFTDEHRHPYFHTNNLWFDLYKLKEILTLKDGVLGLPLIRNEKTVDPADKNSTAVYQIEAAMGAAIEVFEGASAIVVDRSRFLPVKATSDLLLVRSDVYELNEAYALEKVVDEVPLIKLADPYYKLVGDFEKRFQNAMPSLKQVKSLTINGDWTFEAGVELQGQVVLGEEGGFYGRN